MREKPIYLRRKLYLHLFELEVPIVHCCAFFSEFTALLSLIYVLKKNFFIVFESCGVADLITTCYGGRNARIAKEFVLQRKSVQILEKELLNGQKSQGPETAAEVNFMLKGKGLEDQFPLFTAVHRIFTNDMKPEELIECLRNYPTQN